MFNDYLNILEIGEKIKLLEEQKRVLEAETEILKEFIQMRMEEKLAMEKENESGQKDDDDHQNEEEGAKKGENERASSSAKEKPRAVVNWIQTEERGTSGRDRWSQKKVTEGWTLIYKLEETVVAQMKEIDRLRKRIEDLEAEKEESEVESKAEEEKENPDLLS
uniref:Uncharacterized protein n=1 Tax=Caenorhabditis tropicalis TaxID=1561998 RepID=A0A1I7V3E9_9PELO